MDVYYIYLCTAVVALVIGYAMIRGIDFLFTKQEDKRRYKYAKGCIQSYNDGQKRMAQSLIKGINNNLYEMYKKMGDL